MTFLPPNQQRQSTEGIQEMKNAEQAILHHICPHRLSA